MNDRALKPSWAPVKFGDVVRQVKDKADAKSSGLKWYVAGEHMDTDDLRIWRRGEITDDYLGPAFHMRFKPGHVLYGSRRTYLRKVAVADFEGICANTTFVLKSRDPNMLLPELLPFIMQTEAFHDFSIQNSKGSVNPYINFSDLAEYKFALPPLVEQRRIADLLLASQAQRETLSDAIALGTSAEDAFLLDLFGRYASEDSRWHRVGLGRLAYIQTGVAKGKKADPAQTVDVPYLAVSNVQDGYLDLSEVNTIVVEKSKVDQVRLQIGDVLMTEGGDPDKLGRGTVWQGEIEGCVHQNHVFAVRPNTSSINPWFLATVARSSYGKQYFLSCSKRTSNLATINKKQVSELMVPLPAIATQERIVADWRTIRAAIDHARKRLRQAQQLQGALLNSAVGARE